jgi:hypothetical protein
MAKRRQTHEAQMRDIEAQMVELQKKRNQLKQAFKAGNKALNDLCNQPTKHSIMSHRMRDAHNIKRVIGGQLKDWKSDYLDMEGAKVCFCRDNDIMNFVISIPFKHSPVEDQIDLF